MLAEKGAVYVVSRLWGRSLGFGTEL